MNFGTSSPLRKPATIAVVALAILVAGCATRRAAPVEDRAALPPRVSQVPLAPVEPPDGGPALVPGEPDWRPTTYTVKRGDTLHAIALEHGLDYRELAAWNNIENPNLIRVGQVLRLSPGDAAGETTVGVTTAPLRTPPPVVESRTGPAPAAPAVALAPSPPTAKNTDTHKVAPKAVKERYTPELAREMAKAASEPVQIARAEPTKPVPPPVVAQPPVPPPAATPAPPPPAVAITPPKPALRGGDDGDELEWMWPVKGKLVTGFSDTANLKGIDIAGTAGQPVLASAPGRVVYAGSGLRGYGKLVIIKHNNTFLSAYAHNRDIVVKEGQEVVRGQKIAEMGSTDTDTVKLHFEIRRLGRPMDPLKYLPPA